MSLLQHSLPGLERSAPDGFVHSPDLVTPAQGRELVQQFQQLQFGAFEFHGHEGKRRVVYYGHRYDFNQGAVLPAEPVPAFLLPLRDLAAEFAQLDPAALQHALVTEYPPGAGIGWHRDRPAFDDISGIFFASACRFRMRWKAGAEWERFSLSLEPLSAYLLRGPARLLWEHSIPPGEALRYSVTFRSMR